VSYHAVKPFLLTLRPGEMAFDHFPFLSTATLAAKAAELEAAKLENADISEASAGDGSFRFKEGLSIDSRLRQIKETLYLRDPVTYPLTTMIAPTRTTPVFT